jgi:hypothetical protein
MINWDATDDDTLAIHRIAKRWATMTGQALLDTDMDITACHLNGCPLDLAKLAAFDDANFGHDVGGIRHYIHHDTGELTNCFVPRCAA